jgi:hypothetical protein
MSSMLSFDGGHQFLWGDLKWTFAESLGMTVLGFLGASLLEN